MIWPWYGARLNSWRGKHELRAERLAILQLLGTNESVPGRVLYQLCNKRVVQRVRELRSIGMDIRHWGETGPDGMGYDVYGWIGIQAVASVQAAQRGRRQRTKLEESDVRPAGIGLS